MRILKLACQNFSRNFILSLTSIVVILLMLFSLSLLYNINVLTQETLNSFKAKMDLSIYLKQNVNENQVNLFRTELENMPEVKEIHYITPQQALEQFEEKHKNDPLILKSLEELKENPFGAAITIKLRDSINYETVLAITEKPAYQTIIQDHDFYDYQQIISAFNKFNTRIHYAGWIISGIFVLIAILIIFNTIKLGILARQKEIKIMRLVGATAWFIRGPFLLESCLYASVAWLLNSLIIISVSLFLRPYIKQFLESDFDFFIYLKIHSFEFFGGLLFFALIISMLASSAAIKKYLRV